MPYHWGRYRGLAQDMKRPPLDELIREQRVLRHVRLPPGRASICCSKIVPVDNILFGSEMVGAVRGIDPETGQYFDDTKRYIDSVAWLSDEDRRKIYEGNIRRVYPRLNACLPRQTGAAQSAQ